MSILKRFLVLAALAVVPILSAAPRFAQDESDLKPDPAAQYGSLPNGVRYVLIQNKEPKGRASLRLVVQAGSLNEDDDQQGLAHFLEHMAFNGSTHYAPGTLVELLQRMGMGFGADTNASTSFDRTIYQLELPDTQPQTLATGIQIFADYGGGLLLTPEKIEKERGIILSEKRTRDSVQYRSFIAQFGFVLDGARLPTRVPIGLTDIIEQSKRDRFARFYDTWYRPELLTVVVVGDFPSDEAVKKLIEDDFGPMVARTPARPVPDMGKVPEFAGVRALYHSEPEAPETKVSITSITAYERQPDTAAGRLKDLPRDLANQIINRRLEILSQKEGVPFIRGEASADEEFNFFHDASIELSCKADQWKPALALAEQELRQALTYGFEPAELHEAVAELTNSLEQAAKSASTRRSEEVAGELVDTVVDRKVFTSAAEDLALYGPALKAVTPEDCLAALRAAWAADRRSLIVSGNAALGTSAEAQIVAAYETAKAAAVTAPAKQVDAAWAYANFGPVGKVTATKTIDDLGITEVVFANGVRLNLKKTDFEANVIHVNARAGSGLLSEPRDEPGLKTYADVTFTAGGLGQHSADDLTRILAGRTVGVSFKVDTDAFDLGGETNRDDLLLELQWVTASLMDPGYRPEAQRVAAKEIESAYLSFEHTSNGPFSLEVPRLLAGGDSRFGLPPKDVMLSRTLAEEKTWLAPQLAQGPLEVAIVGDIDIDATIAAVGATLGALPPRAAKVELADAEKITLPSSPLTKDYTVPTQIPKGAIALYWPTADAFDVHRGRRLNLLSQIVTDRLRLKVREQMGGAYSPYARSEASDIFPGYGYISAHITVDPALSAKIGDAVDALAAELALHGVTTDELDRAKKPLLTSLRESVRTNAYWLGVLSRAQERPEVLDWARTRETDFTAITEADMNALAATYLGAGKASRFTVIPAPAETPHP